MCAKKKEGSRPKKTKIARVQRPVKRIKTDMTKVTKSGKIQEHIARALDAAHIATFEWNIKDGGLLFSEGIQKIFGRSNLPASYKALTKMLPPGDMQLLSEKVKKILKSNRNLCNLMYTLKKCY